jgi:arginyl-tRNA synthetase
MRADFGTHLTSLIGNEFLAAFRDVHGSEPVVPIEIRPSDRPEFGDFCSNVAMVEAQAAGAAPRQLAKDLMEALKTRLSSDLFADVQLAGPGFINVFLRPAAFHAALRDALTRGTAFGRSDRGGGKRVQIEFVSSNPTGPLTIGHGRQAVLGDVLATLYDRLGYAVEREYYFNDEGRQIDLLAESLWIRYRELFGEQREIPEGGYRGEYLRQVAEEVRTGFTERFPVFDDATRAVFREEAVGRMTARIKEDLAALGVEFDEWFSEAALHRSGEVDAALNKLWNANGVYEEDGAVWLRAEENGGIKDSVLIRSDGRPTYLMVDVAYHINKHNRGFDRIINVQGADHQVEQSCVKAAMRILGYPDGFVEYAVHQFVSLKENGEIQRMSTRAGRFVLLRPLVDELGRDILRYFMISRKPEAHLDFDLDLARSESLDNPATYIQYAHTRIASIFRNAGLDEADWAAVDLSPLVQSDELDLVKRVDRLPDVIQAAAESFAPHLLTDYVHELAQRFHAYYDKHRVLSDDKGLTHARLALLYGVRSVVQQTLEILGMSAPEEM